MLVVSAIITAAAGKGDELEKAFVKLIPQIREKEKGTLAFIPHRGLKDPSKFFVYEKYRAKEDLEAHAATPHMQEFGKAFASLTTGRPEITMYREVG